MHSDTIFNETNNKYLVSFDYSQTCSSIEYLICDFLCDLSILKRGTTKGKVTYSLAQLRDTYIYTYMQWYKCTHIVTDRYEMNY